MPDCWGDSVGLDTLARAGLATPLQMIDLKIDLKGAENKLRSVSSIDGSEKVSTFTKARYLLLYFVFNLALTLFNKALLIEVMLYNAWAWFLFLKPETSANCFNPDCSASVSIHIDRHPCFGRMHRNLFLALLGCFYAQDPQQQGFVGNIRILRSVYGQYCGLQLIAVREIPSNNRFSMSFSLIASV